MKWLRLLSLAVLLVALVAPGVVWAEPDVVTGFTILPGSAYVGDTVTMTADFTVATADLNAENTLCLYFVDGDYATSLDGVGDLTSALGDTYTQSATTGPNVANGPCLAVAGQYVTRWTITDPTDDAEFGDTVSFSFVVPAGAATETFRLRQRNATSQVGGSNRTLTINSIGATVYVANDSATCGSYAPCLTGPGALNSAVDNVTGPGDVFVLGDYLMSPNTAADLTTAKTVTISGVGSASVNMAAGTCSGAALVNNGGVLTVQNVALDGTCTSSNRTAAIRNNAGTLNVRNVIVRDFAGSGSGVAAAGGTVVVEGSTFSGNQAALDGNGGTLYAFANNVTTNLGASAAVNIETGDNVRCNYWGSYNVSGGDRDVQFEERLGSPAATYIEGIGALTLGRASLAAGTGSRVLVNLGRNTSAPPFGNGTVIGLGSLTSDFFVVCLARDGSVRGDLTITADNVTPGPTGHRLYHITATADCSPATNMACWDFTGQSGLSAGAALTDTVANEGHYVIGNEVDPTAIAINNFTASSSTQTSGVWLALIATASLLAGVWLWRRRQTAR